MLIGRSAEVSFFSQPDTLFVVAQIAPEPSRCNLKLLKLIQERFVMNDIEGPAEVDQGQDADVSSILCFQEMVGDANQCSGCAVPAAESMLVDAEEVVAVHVGVDLGAHQLFYDFAYHRYVGDGSEVLHRRQCTSLV